MAHDTPRALYVALLAAVLFLVGIAVGNSAEACGKERWPVKVGTDRDIAKVSMEPQQTTVAALAAIIAPKNPDAQRDTRYAPTELRTYTVSGTMTVIKHEDDGDYHIVLRDGAATMIVESAAPECANGSVVAAQILGVRHVLKQHLGIIAGRKAGLSIPVTVTGIGFFDKCHGQEGRAPNCIELHPVLEITFQ